MAVRPSRRNNDIVVSGSRTAAVVAETCSKGILLSDFDTRWRANHMKGLEGKSVIVTGAASGIGRSAALLLAEAGCLMTIADLNESGCAETVATIEAHGGTAQWLRTDVSREAE